MSEYEITVLVLLAIIAWFTWRIAADTGALNRRLRAIMGEDGKRILQDDRTAASVSEIHDDMIRQTELLEQIAKQGEIE